MTKYTGEVIKRDLKPCIKIKDIKEYKTKVNNKVGSLGRFKDEESDLEFSGNFSNESNPDHSRIKSWTYDPKTLDVFPVAYTLEELLRVQLQAMKDIGVTPNISMV